MAQTKYAIVQHSGYGYSGKEGFKQGLEVRSVSTLREQAAVERAGGLLFDSFGEASDFTEDEKVVGPGLYPAARGTFSEVQVDGLAVYVPVRETTVVG